MLVYAHQSFVVISQRSGEICWGGPQTDEMPVHDMHLADPRIGCEKLPTGEPEGFERMRPIAALQNDKEGRALADHASASIRRRSTVGRIPPLR